MEYYIISFIISIFIFIIIQIIEYNKNNNDKDPNNEPYNLFKTSNILLFLIIYIVFTIGFFYLKPSLPSSISSLFKFNLNNTNTNNTNNNTKIDGGVKEEIDPKVLSKITDNFDTGFAPFNSDDESSLSSMSSKED